MVYKIVGNLFDSFTEIFEILKKYHKFIYKNGNIYLSLKKYKDKELSDKELDKIKEMQNNNIFVIQIDENNLKNEPPDIIEWCRNNFVSLEREKYEIENQDGIKYMFEVLDLFEENLNKSFNNINRKEEDNV